MIDIEAIRKRNEEREHRGECPGWNGMTWTFAEADCDCTQKGVKADIDALLAEVERLNLLLSEPDNDDRNALGWRKGQPFWPK